MPGRKSKFEQAQTAVIVGPWLPVLLKTYRERHWLGVREMARRLGTSPSTYSRIENGLGELTSGTVIDLLHMLAVGTPAATEKG